MLRNCGLPAGEPQKIGATIPAAVLDNLRLPRFVSGSNAARVAHERANRMPIINRPPVSPAVLDEIQRAERMHNFILRTIPDKFLSDTDEKILVAAFFSLSLEHHGAILHLIREGQFDGSAFALVRPLIDAAYRAHWIYSCAKPEIVLRIKKGDDVYPGLTNIASEIEKRSDAGGIFATIGPYLRALHGYTHGGLEQLGRRFDAEGNVRANYSDGEKCEAIKATTGHLTALAVAWCQLVSTDAPEREPRSKAISDYYIALYEKCAKEATGQQS